MHPPLALSQSFEVMKEMAEETRRSVEIATSLLHEYSDDDFQKVRDLETEVDDYEDKLGSYLLRLSGQQLSIQQSGEVTKYLHTLSDFERISDHARNIAESSAELHEKQLLL